jgi:hypothetical protein
VADLVELALEAEPPLDIGDKGERSQRTRLGILIGKARDRQFKIAPSAGTVLQVCITHDGDAHNAQRWRLVPVNVGNVGERLPGPGAESTALAHPPGDPPATPPAESRGPENVSHVPHVHPDPSDAVPAATVDAASEDDWGEV